MFDANAIKALADLGVKAAGPVSFRPEGMPEGIVLVRDADGDYCPVPIPHPHRAHRVQDLNSIVELARDAIERPNRSSTERPFVEFYYSRSGVVLVYPDNRRDRATVALTPSERMEILQGWESNRAGIGQEELIKTLRVVFKGLASQDITDLVRRISITTDTTSNQGRTEVSLGKNIQARLGETNALPEYLTFTVPVFEEGAFAGHRAAIECALDFNPKASVFFLTPVTGAIEAAFTKAEDDLARSLTAIITERGIPSENYGLYFGQP